MSKQTRRLGRGLGSLISGMGVASRGAALEVGGEPPGVAGGRHTDAARDGTEATGRSQGGADGSAAAELDHIDDSDDSVESASLEMPLDRLHPNPYQPRHDPGDADIESLARSIQINGLIQPIIARRDGDGYQIVAGERRWRAARRAGRETIPVIVRDATDEQMLELALIENLQRQDLNAIDRARAYRRYCSHFGLAPEQVAAKMGEDRTTVVNYLRLLDLEDDIQEQVASGTISMGHARCLLGIQSGPKRRNIVRAILDHQLSVRATEEMVRKEKAKGDAAAAASPPPAARKSAHLQDVERRFEDALKTKVFIKESRKKHRGRIVIEYYTLDDFDRVASMLGVAVES